MTVRVEVREGPSEAFEAPPRQPRWRRLLHICWRLRYDFWRQVYVVELWPRRADVPYASVESEDGLTAIRLARQAWRQLHEEAGRAA